jgi:3-methyladenine DNA glycosylase AlkC
MGPMPEPLKDFVDIDLVKRLGERMQLVYRGFARDEFVRQVSAVLPDLELKDRMAAIAGALAERLPAAFPEAVALVVEALESAETPLSGWEAWPLATYIELCGTGHPAESLDAMERVSPFMSCEMAIRPFLERYPEQTFERLERWVDHPDASVRRLVSEGTRPLLPWGKRVAALREDPLPGIRLIERLRDDPSEDVRRSVANHLNDVSKDHPELAVETARRWAKEGSVHTQRLLEHALRTLVKKGNPGALEVLGFTTAAEVEVDAFVCRPTEVPIGGEVELRARLRSTSGNDQHLVVDYIVHYVKRDGSSRPKVFKWKTLDLAAGAEIGLRRKQHVQDQSTRIHHPGLHRVELQVAGVVAAETAFELLPAR